MSASEIQKLREVTSAGVMDCKRALAEAKGNFDEALKIIQKNGLSKAEKRADRKTGAGLVHSYVHSERVGVIVELRSETDFVAHSEPFRALIHDIAMHIAAMAPLTVEELVAQPFVRDESRTIKDLVTELTSKVGEKIEVGKFYRIEV
ncbi:MAG: translation elongation factor Ts [bacterium]|nr:translation elongation factor Ts [bacterium]